MTRHWYGMLCAETRDAIADRMHAVLDGNYFTYAGGNSYDANSDRFLSIDVRTSERLSSPIQVHKDGISWGTRTYSMGVHTKARTPSEARDGKPHKYVHFTFDYDRITIDHYAPAGYRLQWIFVVERHDDEESA